MKAQPLFPAPYYIPAVAFLLLTLLAFSDVFIVPKIPGAPGALLAVLHELHDLLAAMIALFLAHRRSAGAGRAGIVWFVALHVALNLGLSSLTAAEGLWQAILLAAALLGIHVIEARNRLEAELETQRAAAFKLVDELILLNGIATIGVEAVDVDSLAQDAVQVINSALHPDYFDIGLLDEDSGTLRVYHSSHEVDAGPLTIPAGKGVIGQVVASGQLRRIADVRLEPSFLAVHPGVQSELCVPLKIAKRVLGALNIESKQLDAFSEADEHTLMTFADQLVTAIEKVRLLQSEQGHAREAETLREAGAIVAATLSQDETIERILVQLKRVIPYDSASVQLLGDGHLQIVGGNGFSDPAAVAGMRFPIPGDNPNTVVVQERRPYILNDAPAAHTAFREGPHNHIRSFLGVPLIVGGQVIGMLAIDSTHPNFFVADHVRLVMAFADQVALAIQNAKLFSEVQQLARIDGLTHLYNRRHFTEMARHEFERARRYHHPLTAIMLDIDHFKNVNDTHGHAVGDQVLQIVAARCQAIVREIDVLGRYGGEEFVSLVLETDLQGGEVVAERLRQTVAEPPIDTDHGTIAVTISLGIAVLDKDCRDLEDLLRRADQALYAAKQAGRNQVATWRE